MCWARIVRRSRSSKGRHPFMIRFLQKDSRLTKVIYVVIIGAAVVTMVITLVPGIFQDASTGTDTYATITGKGFFGRLLGGSQTVSNTEVQRAAERQIQQNHYPDFLLNFMVERVGQGLIQQAILLNEADKLGIHVSDEDLRQVLHTGNYGAVLFPNGQFIGEDRYTEIIQSQLQMSRADFESQLKKSIVIERLRALVTNGVTVSDNEIRDQYRKSATKIKFDYAVISSDDVKKTIKPSDSDLQTYFKQNAARYANAVPERRQIKFFSFSPEQVPGGVPQVTPAELQQYYQAHQADYQLPEQARARHILIKVDQSDPKSDAAAKAKAQGILKQLNSGGNFADLAKKNSDDPGSKNTGGELGFMKKGATVPEFEQALFSLPIGKTSDLVKSQYGYHIIQVEERQAAHNRSLAEVTPSISAVLIRQKEATAAASFAQQLATEAGKSGLEKTAAAHHLNVVTTDFIPQSGAIPGLADGSKVVSGAFAAKQGAAPLSAATGDGYAIYQVAGIQSAHAPGFAEYKPNILTDYIEQQLPKLLDEKTKALAAKAHSSNDLAKSAKEFGATVKTSDLVASDGQVPDVGQLSRVAPGLFDLKQGNISDAIITEHSGIVAKLVDRQEPTPDDIAKNLDQTREKALDQKREEAFGLYVSSLQAQYKKDGRIHMAKQAATPETPGKPGPAK